MNIFHRAAENGMKMDNESCCNYFRLMFDVFGFICFVLPIKYDDINTIELFKTPRNHLCNPYNSTTCKHHVIHDAIPRRLSAFKFD